MSELDWRRIHKEAVIIDLHIHPSMQQQLFNRNLGLRYVMKRTFRSSPLRVRASFPRLRDGGYDVIFSTIHIPEKGLIKDFKIINLFRILRPDLWRKLLAAQPFDATMRVLGEMEKTVAATSGYGWAQMARSVSELDAILASPSDFRPIAVIHSVEGGHSLGGKRASDEGVMKNLDNLFERGVICLTLAHFYPNQLVNPCYPFPEDILHLASRTRIWRDITLGLTDLGKQVVQRMIELGMLIDISHCTPVARREIYDLIDASGKRVPLLASHNGAYEINPSPYNLSDWEIKRIARDGGVIGVIFMPYWLMPKESKQGLNFISRHFQHLVNVGGEDVAGIGTDFDGFTTPPEDLDSASKMPRLTQRLVVDGYSEQAIKKILGGNALRMIHETWGRK
jgi:microsomal dipeptidase-like Zn-dependent dipeptidase